MSAAEVLLLGLDDLTPTPERLARLRRGVAGVELALAFGFNGGIPRSWWSAWEKPTSAETSDGSELLVAVEWQLAGALFEEPMPEPGFLGWELAEGGQPMEVLLPALALGKALAAASVNLLFGPSLALSSDLTTSFGAKAEGVGKAASIFVDGLSAAGVQSCVGRFTADCLKSTNSAESPEVLEAGLPFGLMATRGVPAIEAELSPSVPTGLREALSYEGVIATPLIRPEAGVDPMDQVIGALEQGFDLIRLADEPAQDRVLEGLGREIERRGLIDRHRRASERVKVLRFRI